MRTTIIRRSTSEEFSFWAPAGGGYIYRELPKRPGTLGSQICEGGEYSGATLSTPDDAGAFRAICIRWYRQWLRINDRSAD